jgi:hypothetical protein
MGDRTGMSMGDRPSPKQRLPHQDGHHFAVGKRRRNDGRKLHPVMHQLLHYHFVHDVNDLLPCTDNPNLRLVGLLRGQQVVKL